MASLSHRKSDLFELDIYEELNVTMEATSAEIKSAFRKKALKCHPDKNPDNPEAAAEFDKLKKILEVLLDKSTRAAYNKVLKGRKLAVARARQVSAHNKKLKEDLERREYEAALAKDMTSAKDKFNMHLSRLKKEGERIIAEEVARLDKEAKEERARASNRLQPPSSTPTVQDAEGSYRVKVRWVTPDGAEPYTKHQIHNLFYKWGEINAVVIKQKAQKGSALIDYKTKSGADMALQYEKGLPDCPLIVSELSNQATRNAEPGSQLPKSESSDVQRRKRDYEAIADMEKRRRNERAALIAEMLRNDGVEPDS